MRGAFELLEMKSNHPDAQQFYSGQENGNYYSILGLCRGNGEENGNYYSILGLCRGNGKEKGNCHSILGSQQRPPPTSRLHSTFLAGHTGQKHRTCVRSMVARKPHSPTDSLPGIHIWGFPKIGGTILGGPNNTDCRILRPISFGMEVKA